MKPAAFVLVGGKSSRMGANKALLQVDGAVLAQHVAKKISPFASNVTLVGDPAIYAALGYPVVPDTLPQRGPLGGIHAALQASAEEWVLIAGCDMPLIATDVLLHLIEAIGPDVDYVTPVTEDGRLQPLLALYHRRCLPFIQNALESGNYKVISAIAGLRGRRIPAAARSFRNINTPEDWAAYLSEHV